MVPTNATCVVGPADDCCCVPPPPPPPGRECETCVGGDAPGRFKLIVTGMAVKHAVGGAELRDQCPDCEDQNGIFFLDAYDCDSIDAEWEFHTDVYFAGGCTWHWISDVLPPCSQDPTLYAAEHEARWGWHMAISPGLFTSGIIVSRDFLHNTDDTNPTPPPTYGVPLYWECGKSPSSGHHNLTNLFFWSFLETPPSIDCRELNQGSGATFGSDAHCDSTGASAVLVAIP